VLYRAQAGTAKPGRHRPGRCPDQCL